MTSDQDYTAAAEWAEHDMVLPARSTTARRSPAAAEHGRALLERATGGRPPLTPNAAHGTRAARRQVRLPLDLDRKLEELVSARHTTPSNIMREALTSYLASQVPAPGSRRSTHPSTREEDLMADKKNIHTVATDDGWANRRDGAQRASSTHDTKAEAQAAGRDAAKKDGVEHLIHKKDGTIGEKNSYGNDPHPPKG